ncbi:two-component regulator propeller domain-containing protein [uncultured Microscilla sp.]|uniref:two-component regulator propeller domain-containing protein n=1 Tax=uncultured Microscilla sp. TaxID=432653 RepID=UPI002603CF6F|nr:two-component regulator propeller domain-containing protein [uncultured Microscilla sp.]
MRFWITLYLSCVFFQASAQQYFFRNYSLKAGIPQSEIYALVNGPKGGIWVGTNGGGVARFNGHRFEVFNKQTHGFVHDQIIQLFFDSKDRLWVGTAAGITRFDGKLTKNFPFPATSSSEISLYFYEDPRKPGRIWSMSVLNQKIQYFDGDKVVDLADQYPKQLKNVPFLNFILLHNGNFLIATGKTLLEYNGKVLQESPIALHPRFKGARLNPFLVDNAGNLWLWAVTPPANGQPAIRRLFRYNKKVEEITLPPQVPPFRVNAIGLKDRQGNLWLTTNRNGVLKYDGKEFQHFSTKNGLPTNTTTSLLEDSEGNIWIGTIGAGLVRYSGDTFTLFDQKHTKIASNFIRAIYQDGVGNYWIGTNSRGITRFDGVNAVSFFNTAENEVGRVHDFTRIDDQQFLVTTTRKGVLKYNGEKFVPANTNYGIPANRGVGASFRDGDTYWFGVFGLGVIKYSPEGVDTLSAKKHGLINNIITSITKDGNGHMWFGSLRNATGGLSRYDGKKVTTWHKSDTLKTELVMQMTTDNNGGVWIATYGEGVIRYSDGKFSYVTTKQGISDNTIYSIIKDDEGHIWLGVQGGVDKIILDKQAKIVSIKHFRQEDGFMGIENNGKAVYKDAQGNLWFGTLSGVVKYTPQAHRLYHQKTKLNIKEVRLFLKKVDWQSEEYKQYTQSLDAFFPVPRQLKLPYNLNHITIYFEGISYFIPEKVAYKWRLDGLDKEWSPVSTSQKVTYTNLPPGKYIFRLKARNSWGQWAGQDYVYEFEVLVPYWQTWWFRTLALLGFVLLIVAGFSWRVRAIKAQRKELQRLVHEKTQEVRARNESILEKNAELKQQKKEILVQNEQIHLQNEEIQVQRDQLELSFQNVKLLSEIGQKVTANLSLQKITETFYEQITAVMEVDEFGIGLYDAEQKALVFDLIYIGNDCLPQVTLPLTQTKRLSVHCFLSKKELVSGDVKKDFANYTSIKDTYTEGDLLNSMLCLPILEGEKALGVMTLQARKPDAYADYHVSMVRSLSTYVAIATQNSNVFNQVKIQKREIEIKNENITASINYAKQIQQAILGRAKDIAQYFSDAFVLLKPKDIVSGDFYWSTKVTTEQTQQKIVLVAADCTGHGVPGAFMTLMGSDFLDDIVCKEKVTQPDRILQQLEQRVIERLQKNEGDQVNDGMDMAIISVDPQGLTLDFAGAKNPLWLIRNGELIEYKGAKFPIGGSSQYRKMKQFEVHTIDLQPKDVLYMFSDGYQDQFGGEEGKKFMKRRLRALLVEIHQKPMQEQQKILENTLENWMSYLPEHSEVKQVDDILVIGVSI